MEKTSKNQNNVCEAARASVADYLDLGIRTQDELFKMAQQQMASFREYSEQALKGQAELFNQFEKNARTTRDLWIEGLKRFHSSLEGMTQPRA
ncbi:MAG: hypothetical protein HY815_14490 [Candidatus Riflebacteria bacterium]|nr:hypothetical protein [Candidatus Riflebacteria bacterium]